MKKPELLAPAGSLEKLKLAVLYGADAIFLGGLEFGLRSGANNFSIQEIKEGVEFAREYGVNIYVTTNIYAHMENFIGFKEFVIELEKAGVVGLIVGDPGYIKIAREFAPKLEIHISTQQSITNVESALFYQDYGVQRIVLARELTFNEIKEITDAVNIEVEVFIHGAVCSSYSGRCTLSNFMTSRDSNRGGCCQSCRWDYDLCYFEKGEYKKVELSDYEIPFTMSVMDMNLLEFIPEMINSGIDSLKVEGRMKSFHYIATVIKVYRLAIDEYFKDPTNYKVKPEWIEELKKAEARETYEGALIGDFSEVGQIYKEQYNLDMNYEYCGYVKEYDEKNKIVTIEQRNFFKVGDTIEFFGPGDNLFKQEVCEIVDQDGISIDKANHPLMIVKMKTDKPVAKHWLIRRNSI
ncbi:MAG: peptidase U32 family protein [Mycoplasmatales bacterium]